MSRQALNLYAQDCHSVRTTLSPADELDYASPALPGGTLLASTYDRMFMQLADRGGASNIIGERWADLCAAALDTSTPTPADALRGPDELVATDVVRLDDIPDIARKASANKLQNPDFLLVGVDDSTAVMWAADAKFSVDTARSKQVSALVTEALMSLGEAVQALLPGQASSYRVLDGVFLCPDYPLTHRLLTERRGPRRATVREEEVRFLRVTPGEFLAPLGQEGLQDFLASLDSLPMDPATSLMLALYYFRLARAAVGCWQDQTAPLLAYRDTITVDESAVEAEARKLATMRTSAWGLIQRWNDIADTVREQRAAVDRVTSLPINGRQLRDQVLAAAASAGVVPPSGTRVRRTIGSWFRAEIRKEFGPILPPVDDFDATLDQLRRFAGSLMPQLPQVTARVIADLVKEAEPLRA